MCNCRGAWGGETGECVTVGGAGGGEIGECVTGGWGVGGLKQVNV